MKITLAIIILLCANVKLVSQQIDMDIGSFKQYDALGGYGVGAFVVVDKGLISSDEFPREFFERIILDKTVLETKSLGTIPYYEFDRTNIEKARLAGQINAESSNIAAEIRSGLNSMDSVTLVVEEGERIGFKGGGNTYNRLLRVLPKIEICDLYEYSSKKPRFVTEVLTFKKGTITYHWGTKLSAEAQAKFKQLAGIEGNYTFGENGNIKVEYSSPIEVGYKYTKVKGKRKSRLKRYCKKIDIYYRDADGDGFGTSNDIREVKNGIAPEGYILTGGDCCDNDPNVFPGQTKSYTSANACGNFDYNCDGREKYANRSVGGCGNGCRELNSGWKTNIPTCGQEAHWVTGCDNGNALNRNCTVHSKLITQACN